MTIGATLVALQNPAYRAAHQVRPRRTCAPISFKLTWIYKFEIVRIRRRLCLC